MARIARVVVPGFPHHITQRGNRRQQVFFHDADYEAYIALMSQWCEKYGVEIWAYCLMPNHVHLVAVPETADSLARAIGEAHRRYTRMINFREKWRGYLFQGRFASFPMDEVYLFRAARYIELNPVRAGIVERPEYYRWSSARAHLSGRDDLLVKAAPVLDKTIDWRGYLYEHEAEDFVGTLLSHQRTGRPLGDSSFIESLETILGRELKPEARPQAQIQTQKGYELSIMSPENPPKTNFIFFAIFLIVVGFGIWKYFNQSSGNSSSFPPILIDESRLTVEGLSELRKVREMVSKLEEDPDNMLLICKKAAKIADKLRELGAYRSAAEWHMKVPVWYKKLDGSHKLKSKRLEEQMLETCFSCAGMCYYLDGQEEKAIKIWKKCRKLYGSSFELDAWEHRNNEPYGRILWTNTLIVNRAKPEYVKQP